MVQRDYYEVLGVAKDTDIKYIRKAYLGLATQHHPDKNPDDPTAEERFKEINEAYSVLQNEERRRQYDQFQTLQSLQSSVIVQSQESRKGRSLASIVRARAVRTKEEVDKEKVISKKEREELIRRNTEKVRVYDQKYADTEVLSERIYERNNRLPQEKKIWKQPRRNEKLFSDLLQYKDVLLEKTKMVTSAQSLESCLINSAAEYELHKPNGLIEEVKQYLEEKKIKEYKISDQHIANIIFYTFQIKFDVQSQTKDDLKKVAETLTASVDLETMILAASATRTVLESEYAEAINVNIYAKYFQKLFTVFLPHIGKKDFTTHALAVINEAFNYTINCVYKSHETADILLNILSENENLEITAQLLQIARRSRDLFYYKKAEVDNGRKIKPLADIREKLNLRKGYSSENFLDLVSVIHTIQTVYLPTKSKHDREEGRSYMLRINMPAIKSVAVAAKLFAEYIPKEELLMMLGYVKALGQGAREYTDNNQINIFKEWKSAIDTGFLTYKENPVEFITVMQSIDCLKLNEYGARERYPGLLYPTLEATAFAGKRVIEYALTFDNPSEKINQFYDFMDSYRISSFRTTRKRVKAFQIDKLSEKQVLSEKQIAVYTLIREIPKKGQYKRIVKETMEKLLDIYLRES